MVIEIVAGENLYFQNAFMFLLLATEDFVTKLAQPEAEEKEGAPYCNE